MWNIKGILRQISFNKKWRKCRVTWKCRIFSQKSLISGKKYFFGENVILSIDFASKNQQIIDYRGWYLWTKIDQIFIRSEQIANKSDWILNCKTSLKKEKKNDTEAEDSNWEFEVVIFRHNFFAKDKYALQ